MLVKGRSYWVVPIQEEDLNAEVGTKLAKEITEKEFELGTTGEEAITGDEAITGIAAETKLMAHLAGT